MPVNKNALLRYQILDRCFSDFHRKYEIEDLLDGRQGYTLVRNAAKPLDQEIRSREGGTSLWRWCLLIALVALLTETILLRLCSFKSKK